MTDTRYINFEQDQTDELSLNLETLKDLDPQDTADAVVGGSAGRTSTMPSGCGNC